MSKIYDSEKTKAIVLCALFTAIVTVLSQIVVPLPSGVPITLQTFAVALCGYFLFSGKAAVSMTVYMLIGAIGVPVFAGFHGGLASVLGMSGGFIIGFIPMAALCGINVSNHAARIAFGMLGLIACHLLGTAQFCIVAGVDPLAGFLTASAPFLIKDGVSVVLAYFAALGIKKTLRINRHAA